MSSMKITRNTYIYMLNRASLFVSILSPFRSKIYYCTCYYMLRYTAYQLMVDTVLRLQFRCDENNTKFQQHENLSLPSSHTNMKVTFPEVLSPKRGQKYNKPKSRQ